MVQSLRLLASNAGRAGSIPGWGTKIPHAKEQLSPRATTREPTHSNKKSLCAASREALSCSDTQHNKKKGNLVLLHLQTDFSKVNVLFKNVCYVIN